MSRLPHKKIPPRDRSRRGFLSGGPKRDRTADLHNAIVALSQLSYGPELKLRPRLDRGRKSGWKLEATRRHFKRNQYRGWKRSAFSALVGFDGFRNVLVVLAELRGILD